ncbi:MAG: hypothetical protein A2V88_00210 [Elusimicrobia bacterium RBG_16_66_12]|nr:MAG: hypothetical protein A2V88_00210 [Elusimicrobia bacterium RBG_16_66_12]
MFQFPGLAQVGPTSAQMQRSISLVVVLPLEPEIATMGMSKRRRWKWARAWRDFSVSGTDTRCSGRGTPAGILSSAAIQPDALAASAASSRV